MTRYVEYNTWSSLQVDVQAIWRCLAALHSDDYMYEQVLPCTEYTGTIYKIERHLVSMSMIYSQCVEPKGRPLAR